MRNDRGNIIVDKTFDFALQIIEFSEHFYSKNRFALANQLFKSGISIGANVREAQNSGSKNDFIHKMKIAAKEAEETEYWLMLCSKSEHLQSPTEYMLWNLRDIILILSKIISTAKQK